MLTGLNISSFYVWHADSWLTVDIAELFQIAPMLPARNTLRIHLHYCIKHDHMITAKIMITCCHSCTKITCYYSYATGPSQIHKTLKHPPVRMRVPEYYHTKLQTANAQRRNHWTCKKGALANFLCRTEGKIEHNGKTEGLSHVRKSKESGAAKTKTIKNLFW